MFLKMTMQLPHPGEAEVWEGRERSGIGRPDPGLIFSVIQPADADMVLLAAVLPALTAVFVGLERIAAVVDGCLVHPAEAFLFIHRSKESAAQTTVRQARKYHIPPCKIRLLQWEPCKMVFSRPPYENNSEKSTQNVAVQDTSGISQILLLQPKSLTLSLYSLRESSIILGSVERLPLRL